MVKDFFLILLVMISSYSYGQLDSITQLSHTRSFLKSNFKSNNFNCQCSTCNYDCDSVFKGALRVIKNCEALLSLQKIEQLDSVLVLQTKSCYQDLKIYNDSLSNQFLKSSKEWYVGLDFNLKCLNLMTKRNRAGYLSEQLEFILFSYEDRLKYLRMLNND